MFKKNRKSKSKKIKSFISKKKSIKNKSKKGGSNQHNLNHEEQPDVNAINNQLQEAIRYITNLNNIENIRYRQLIHKQSLIKDPDNLFQIYNNYYGIIRDYILQNNPAIKSDKITNYQLEEIFNIINKGKSGHTCTDDLCALWRDNIQSDIQKNIDFFKKKIKI